MFVDIVYEIIEAEDALFELRMSRGPISEIERLSEKLAGLWRSARLYAMEAPSLLALRKSLKGGIKLMKTGMRAVGIEVVRVVNVIFEIAYSRSVE